MVNLTKFQTVLNMEKLSINEVDWQEDYDSQEKEQIIFTFIGSSSGVYAFTEFYMLVTGIQDISEVPDIYRFEYGSTSYDFDAEYPFFDKYCDYLRTQGLAEFEAENNVTCNIQHDENGDIVLLAVLNGITELIIDYVCLECLKSGTSEVTAYSIDEGLEQLECVHCNSDNLIDVADIEKHNIQEYECKFCGVTSYRYQDQEFIKCFNCGGGMQ